MTNTENIYAVEIYVNSADNRVAGSLELADALSLADAKEEHAAKVASMGRDRLTANGRFTPEIIRDIKAGRITGTVSVILFYWLADDPEGDYDADNDDVNILKHTEWDLKDLF